MKENKLYLNTIEDFTKALNEHEVVYARNGLTGGETKFEIVNNLLVRDDNDGQISVGGSITFMKNAYYLKEKEPLKIEVGKFYKTRDGKKVICAYKSKEKGDSRPYFFSSVGKDDLFTIWVTENGRYLEDKEETCKRDIVGYWE